MGPARRDVTVRVADPRQDRARILGVLARSLSSASAADRYDWLYLSNPHGPARVWLAEDSATGEAVGTSAGHPKRVWVNGEQHEVLDLSDFAMDAAYRTLGPSLKLLRATLEPMQRGEFAFSYDHPSPSMYAIYKRMGARAVSVRRRWLRLLKVSGQLAKRYGPGIGVRLLGHAGDLAMRAKDTLGALPAVRRRGDLTVTPLVPSDDAALDQLDHELRRLTPLRVVRSAAHIRWRYERHTAARHEILCARRGGSLVGFIAIRPQTADILAIVDLIASDPAAPAALVDAVVELGHQRGYSALWVTVLRGSPVEDGLPQLGFVPRNEGPGVVIYAPKANEQLAAALHDPKRWWMLEGDEDV